MKNIFILSLLLILIIEINSGLSDEERKNLYQRVTKSLDYKHLFETSNLYARTEVSYDPSKIKEILNKNNFPSSYNFIDAENPTVNIKNQASCGSCWAFASTTALAYRYHKQGTKVDLSPQDGISCYIRDCDKGDFLLDTHFNLVKNGAVTESCLPFSSANGKTIEQCPSSCKNSNEEFKKYYSKNAYSTILDYDEEHYYDIVTVIIDQLINNGPVESAISIYSDFYNLIAAKNCANIIYKYDGTSSYSGGHAVVIVGYGVTDNRYYWIIQNSWGSSFCDNGFAKIEFGEIGIEQVAFSDPYLGNGTESIDISIKFTELDEECKIKFTSSSSDNYFDMFYTQGNDRFYYQCSKEPNNENVCNMDQKSIVYSNKGEFTFKNQSSLLNKNVYNLDFSSISNKFNFRGIDYIDSFYYDNNIYISESGSKINLYYQHYPENATASLGKIFINKDSNTVLSDCKEIEPMIQCTVNSQELSYFSASNTLPLAYEILCGEKEEMLATVHILDKTKYPLFRVKEVIFPDSFSSTKGENLILVTDMEGSVSQMKQSSYDFYLTLIVTSGKNQGQAHVLCEFDKPSSVQNDFRIYCALPYSYSQFDSIDMYPAYFRNTEEQDPYEIIFENNVEKSTDRIVRFSNSNYLNFNLLLLIWILLFA